MRLSRFIILNISILLLILSFQNLQSASANSSVVLTITLPDWMEQIWGEAIFNDFEQLHPEVNVVIVDPIITEIAYSPAVDLEDYLNYVTNIAANSDIFLLDHLNFYSEAINANLFLDLSPLIEIDTEISESDFYPAIWNSFVWNNGVWGLPIGANFWGLIYRPNIFDTANFAYPNGNWTLDDFTTTVSYLSELSLENQNGFIPGFANVTVDEIKFLFRSLADVNFYDDLSISQTADLVQPNIVQTLDSFSQLYTNKFVQNVSLQQDLLEWIPMRVGPLSLLTNPFSEDTLAGSPLPGNHIGVRSTGFAISSGTAHPEIAYELIKYLITKPEVVSINLYESSALRSIQYETDETTINAEVQALIDLGREEGLSLQNMHYSDYVFYAYNQAINDNSNLLTSLEEFQQQASTNTHLAETYGLSTSFIVDTPDYLPQDNVLNLSIWSSISPIPNPNDWRRFLDQYTATLPNVDFISLNTTLPFVESEYTPDCAVSLIDIDLMPQSTYLDMKPLVIADRQFPIEGYFQPIENDIESDSTLFGLPIGIHPVVLWLNTELNQGTSGELLEDLIYSDDFDNMPFIELRLDSIHDFLLLSSSLGINLFDFSTSPPQILFGNPSGLETLNQIFERIDQGVIISNWLSTSRTTETPPLFFSDMLDINSSYFRSFWYSNDDYVYQPIPFASDLNNPLISFWVSEGYIYSDSTYPDECYSLFRELSLHPDLYYGLPTNYLDVEANIDLPPNVQSFFNEYANMLEAPNVLTIPYQSDIELNWLQEAIIQGYRNNDIPVQLQTVAGRIEDYRFCVTNLGESVSIEEKSNLCANN